MEKRFSNEWVKYSFSEKELKEISTEMARIIAELAKAEDEKKAITSQFKARIDELSAQVTQQAGHINSGYEMRHIKCEQRPDWDKKVWEFVREDTGQVSKTRQMTSNDLQMHIDEVIDPDDKGQGENQEEVEEEKIDEEAESENPEEENPLDNITAKELRAIAADLPGITNTHSMKKEELLERIKEAKGLEVEGEQDGT